MAGPRAKSSWWAQVSNPPGLAPRARILVEAELQALPPGLLANLAQLGGGPAIGHTGEIALPGGAPGRLSHGGALGC